MAVMILVPADRPAVAPGYASLPITDPGQTAAGMPRPRRRRSGIFRKHRDHGTHFADTLLYRTSEVRINHNRFEEIVFERRPSS